MFRAALHPSLLVRRERPTTAMDANGFGDAESRWCQDLSQSRSPARARLSVRLIRKEAVAEDGLAGRQKGSPCLSWN